MKNIFDIVVALLGLLGLCFIFFLVGVASQHFEWSVSRPIENAFEAARSWQEAIKDQNKQQLQIEGNEEASLDYEAFDKKISYDSPAVLTDELLITLWGTTKAWRLDMKDGSIIHKWNMPFLKAFPHPTHVNNLAHAKVYFEKADVLKKDNLLAIMSGHGDTPHGYGLVKMDKDSNVIWAYADNVHHDFFVDPQSGVITTLVHKFTNSAPKGFEGLKFPMLVDYVVTLSPEGKEVRRISLLEAFKDTPFEAFLYYKNPQKEWDHFHTNSVAVLQPEMAEYFPLFQTGDILLSIRNMSTIAVLDAKTGKIKWAQQGIWRQQHSAHFTRRGTILLFDNKGQYFNKKTYSRILEFNPLTQELVVHYSGNDKNRFFSDTQGRVMEADSEHFFIAESNQTKICKMNSTGDVLYQMQLTAKNKNIKSSISSLVFIKK